MKGNDKLRLMCYTTQYKSYIIHTYYGAEHHIICRYWIQKKKNEKKKTVKSKANARLITVFPEF